MFASGAISTFVLPLRIEESVYADGGWVRNFPLAYAYREPAVHRIVGARYRASAAGFTGKGLHSWHHRMSRLARVRVARGVTEELRSAIERQSRGEPMHLIDTISRLSHIAVYRNSDLEVLLADERDRSLQAVHDVREQMRQTIAGSTRGRQRAELLAALDEAFDAADFPFKRSRVVPRLVVDLAVPEGVHLDVTRRRVTWSDEDKQALVRHGRRLTEEALEGWLDGPVELEAIRGRRQRWEPPLERGTGRWSGLHGAGVRRRSDGKNDGGDVGADHVICEGRPRLAMMGGIEHVQACAGCRVTLRPAAGVSISSRPRNAAWA